MSETILLVDDEEHLRSMLEAALRHNGYEVHPVATGRAALTAVSEHNPDLIVCDIQLPGRDGYAVLAAVRADPDLGAIPFIFLTARGEKADQRQGMVQGADDYLVKPVAIADLLAAIRARLARFARPPRRADFTDARPLEALGLSPKQAEILLWVAQGKSNAEAAAILGVTEGTVKKHLEHIFAKLGVEKRGAASLLAIERLSR